MPGTDSNPTEASTLQSALGYEFTKQELLLHALTHSSRARELDTLRPDDAELSPDNEQLEFLGDAVLGFVTTEELFQRFPRLREGSLSKLRAHLVSEKHLISVAKRLELGSYLRLGKGEEKSGGRAKTALLVDALEALIGAMYLDGGIKPAREFVLQQVVRPELESIHLSGSEMPLTDYKSALQERLQAGGRSQPTYALVDEHGPEHRKTFTVEARLSPLDPSDPQGFVGRAVGPRKKSAEQEAARQLLEQLTSKPLPDEPKATKRHNKRSQ
ncbi:MAG: ribonuclease III [Acidobacteriales bacterium]|nr:ribonuclease III [Terriglobales bacterium]